MRTEIVRPRKLDGKPLTVRDRKGRKIPYKKEGVEVVFDTFISRICKEGDLDIKKKGKFVNLVFNEKKEAIKPADSKGGQ